MVRRIDPTGTTTQPVSVVGSTVTQDVNIVGSDITQDVSLTGSTAVDVTPFMEWLMTSRRSLVDPTSVYGASTIVDNTTTTGTGALIQETGGEIEIRSGTATSNVARVQTKRRMVYAPGFTGESGIGIRIPSNPTGTQVIRWGMFDDENGFGFGVDATGEFIFVRRAGSDTITRVANWNVDPTVIDLSAGAIFRLKFTWYGYGTVEFCKLKNSSASTAVETQVVHRFTPSGQTSIIDPNQPVRVEVLNGAASSTSISAFIGGRSLQATGDDKCRRSLCVVRQAVSVAVATTPVVALRKAATFRSRPNSVNVSPVAVTVISSTDTTLYRCFINPTVTGGSWIAPPNITTGETACEVNISATAISDGVQINAGFATPAGSGGRSGAVDMNPFDSIYLGNSDVFCVTFERVSGGGAATASLVVDWMEEW